MLMRKWW